MLFPCRDGNTDEAVRFPGYCASRVKSHSWAQRRERAGDRHVAVWRALPVSVGSSLNNLR